MRYFWPIYLSSALAATAVVYVGAPYARPFVEPFLPAPQQETEAAGTASPAVRLKASDAAPVAVPSRQQQTAAAPAAVADPEEDESPPALKNIYLATPRDIPGWGVTHQQATYYQTDGSRVGTVPGGTLFACQQARRTSSKGMMVECRFLRNGETNGAFLVGRKDVHLFTGTHADLSRRQLEALQRYYSLAGQIGLKKNELLQQAAGRNPYFASYQAAYRAYMAQIDKAKAVADRRDSATELDRARIEEHLRELKVEEVRVKAAFDAAHQKFREWKDQHASELAKPENDPDIRRWTAERETLRKAVPGLTL